MGPIPSQLDPTDVGNLKGLDVCQIKAILDWRVYDSMDLSEWGNGHPGVKTWYNFLRQNSLEKKDEQTRQAMHPWPVRVYGLREEIRILRRIGGTREATAYVRDRMLEKGSDEEVLEEEVPEEEAQEEELPPPILTQALDDILAEIICKGQDHNAFEPDWHKLDGKEHIDTLRCLDFLLDMLRIKPAPLPSDSKGNFMSYLFFEVIGFSREIFTLPVSLPDDTHPVAHRLVMHMLCTGSTALITRTSQSTFTSMNSMKKKQGNVQILRKLEAALQSQWLLKLIVDNRVDVLFWDTPASSMDLEVPCTQGNRSVETLYNSDNLPKISSDESHYHYLPLGETEPPIWSHLINLIAAVESAKARTICTSFFAQFRRELLQLERNKRMEAALSMVELKTMNSAALNKMSAIDSGESSTNPTQEPQPTMDPTRIKGFPPGWPSNDDATASLTTSPGAQADNDKSQILMTSAAHSDKDKNEKEIAEKKEKRRRDDINSALAFFGPAKTTSGFPPGREPQYTEMPKTTTESDVEKKRDDSPRQNNADWMAQLDESFSRHHIMKNAKSILRGLDESLCPPDTLKNATSMLNGEGSENAGRDQLVSMEVGPEDPANSPQSSNSSLFMPQRKKMKFNGTEKDVSVTVQKDEKDNVANQDHFIDCLAMQEPTSDHGASEASSTSSQAAETGTAPPVSSPKNKGKGKSKGKPNPKSPLNLEVDPEVAELAQVHREEVDEWAEAESQVQPKNAAATATKKKKSKNKKKPNKFQREENKKRQMDREEQDDREADQDKSPSAADEAEIAPLDSNAFAALAPVVPTTVSEPATLSDTPQPAEVPATKSRKSKKKKKAKHPVDASSGSSSKPDAVPAAPPGPMSKTEAVRAPTRSSSKPKSVRAPSSGPSSKPGAARMPRAQNQASISRTSDSGRGRVSSSNAQALKQPAQRAVSRQDGIGKAPVQGEMKVASGSGTVMGSTSAFPPLPTIAPPQPRPISNPVIRNGPLATQHSVAKPSTSIAPDMKKSPVNSLQHNLADGSTKEVQRVSEPTAMSTAPAASPEVSAGPLPQPTTQHSSPNHDQQKVVEGPARDIPMPCDSATIVSEASPTPLPHSPGHASAEDLMAPATPEAPTTVPSPPVTMPANEAQHRPRVRLPFRFGFDEEVEEEDGAEATKIREKEAEQEATEIGCVDQEQLEVKSKDDQDGAAGTDHQVDDGHNDLQVAEVQDNVAESSTEETRADAKMHSDETEAQVAGQHETLIQENPVDQHEVIEEYNLDGETAQEERTGTEHDLEEPSGGEQVQEQPNLASQPEMAMQAGMTTSDLLPLQYDVFQPQQTNFQHPLSISAQHLGMSAQDWSGAGAYVHGPHPLPPNPGPFWAQAEMAAPPPMTGPLQVPSHLSASAPAFQPTMFHPGMDHRQPAAMGRPPSPPMSPTRMGGSRPSMLGHSGPESIFDHAPAPSLGAYHFFRSNQHIPAPTGLPPLRRRNPYPVPQNDSIIGMVYRASEDAQGMTIERAEEMRHVMRYHEHFIAGWEEGFYHGYAAGLNAARQPDVGGHEHGGQG